MDELNTVIWGILSIYQYSSTAVLSLPLHFQYAIIPFKDLFQQCTEACSAILARTLNLELQKCTPTSIKFPFSIHIIYPSPGFSKLQNNSWTVTLVLLILIRQFLQYSVNNVFLPLSRAGRHTETRPLLIFSKEKQESLPSKWFRGT